MDIIARNNAIINDNDNVACSYKIFTLVLGVLVLFCGFDHAAVDSSVARGSSVIKPSTLVFAERDHSDAANRSPMNAYGRVPSLEAL